jgi:DNA-binding NarL/FixJ family response regulator
VDVVAVAEDGAAAISAARRNLPDLVLLDVRMPRVDGIAAATQIARTCTVVMLTYAAEDEVVLAAVRAGASGYLVHGEFAPGDLVDVLEQAHAGGGVLTPAVAATILRALRDPLPVPAGRYADDLSPRLREVMALMASGRSNAQIAAVLHLSEKTVKNHVNHIFSRLGATSRSEAVARWFGLSGEDPEFGSGAPPTMNPRALGRRREHP